MEVVNDVRRVNFEDIVAVRGLQDELDDLCQSLYDSMKTLPKTRDEISWLMASIVDLLGEANIKNTYPQYSQGTWFADLLNQMSYYLYRSCQRNVDWQSALDDVEGKRSLPVMTIHKSKSLQYHTIVFLALDDEAWWSFSREPEEGRATFFVAFSRAKQRVIFTYCESRGGRAGVASLYDLLRSAGVETRVVAPSPNY